jgi:hypothetical protein
VATLSEIDRLLWLKLGWYVGEIRHGGEEFNKKDYAYVVVAGETDADGISAEAGSITLVGSATIKDFAGNAAASPLAHPAMSAQSDIRVDTGDPAMAFCLTAGPERTFFRGRAALFSW